MAATSNHKAAPPIRLLLVDDHAMFRTGLRKLFEDQSDMKLVGEAADGESAVKLVMRLKPDVVLLDLSIPELSGMEVLKRLGDRQCRSKCILLTASIDRRQII